MSAAKTLGFEWTDEELKEFSQYCERWKHPESMVKLFLRGRPRNFYIMMGRKPFKMHAHKLFAKDTILFEFESGDESRRFAPPTKFLEETTLGSSLPLSLNMSVLEPDFVSWCEDSKGTGWNLGEILSAIPNNASNASLHCGCQRTDGFGFKMNGHSKNLEVEFISPKLSKRFKIPWSTLRTASSKPNTPEGKETK
mgnify:CR=1 FL=1